MNLLYYGDNLDVLRRHIDKESVDRGYLDPRFTFNASYNFLFAGVNAGPWSGSDTKTGGD